MLLLHMSARDVDDAMDRVCPMLGGEHLGAVAEHDVTVGKYFASIHITPVVQEPYLL